MATGTVKWFNDEKGYGFIKPDAAPARDVFVHYSGLKRTGGQRATLVEGDKVEFEEVDSDKGRKAMNVIKMDGEAGHATVDSGRNVPETVTESRD